MFSSMCFHLYIKGERPPKLKRESLPIMFFSRVGVNFIISPSFQGIACWTFLVESVATGVQESITVSTAATVSPLLLRRMTCATTI